jgi:hypothetical protein
MWHLSISTCLQVAALQLDLALALTARAEAPCLVEAEALARRALTTAQQATHSAAADLPTVANAAGSVPHHSTHPPSTTSTKGVPAHWAAHVVREADAQLVLSAVLAADAALLRELAKHSSGTGETLPAGAGCGSGTHAALLAWLSGHTSHTGSPGGGVLLGGPHGTGYQSPRGGPVTPRGISAAATSGSQSPRILTSSPAGHAAQSTILMLGSGARLASTRPSASRSALAAADTRARKALAAAKAAYELHAAAHGPDSALAGDALAQCAHAAALGLGGWAQAEPLFRAATEQKLSSLGPLHPVVLTLLEEASAVAAASGHAATAARRIARHLPLAEAAAVPAAVTTDEAVGARGVGEAQVLAALSRLTGESGLSTE